MIVKSKLPHFEEEVNNDVNDGAENNEAYDASEGNQHLNDGVTVFDLIFHGIIIEYYPLIGKENLANQALFNEIPERLVEFVLAEEIDQC